MNRGDIAEDIGLVSAVPVRPPESHGLVVVGQSGVRLAQRVVDAAEIVEDRRLRARAAELGEVRADRLVTGERPGRRTTRLLQITKSDTGIPLFGMLSEALPQGESTL